MPFLPFYFFNYMCCNPRRAFQDDSPQIQNEMPELEINQPPIPYIPPAEQPIDKKKAFKIVKIVVACVIGAVIIAGISF